MTKNAMMDFLDRIAGGREYEITQKQLEANRGAITAAITRMKKFYRESPLISNMIREYYEQDFKRIDAASNDYELIVAIECLRASLYYQ